MDTLAPTADDTRNSLEYLAISNEALRLLFDDEPHKEVIRVLRSIATPRDRLVEVTVSVVRAARARFPTTPTEILLRVANETLADAIRIAEAAGLFNCDSELRDRVTQAVMGNLTN